MSDGERRLPEEDQKPVGGESATDPGRFCDIFTSARQAFGSGQRTLEKPLVDRENLLYTHLDLSAVLT